MGFRVASIPEPSSLTLSIAALMMLMLCRHKSVCISLNSIFDILLLLYIVICYVFFYYLLLFISCLILNCLYVL